MTSKIEGMVTRFDGKWYAGFCTTMEGEEIGTDQYHVLPFESMEEAQHYLNTVILPDLLRAVGTDIESFEMMNGYELPKDMMN